MKKITFKIEEELYRKAHLKTVERGTSVSAMVRDYLASLAAEPEIAEAATAKSSPRSRIPTPEPPSPYPPN